MLEITFIKPVTVPTATEHINPFWFGTAESSTPSDGWVVQQVQTPRPVRPVLYTTECHLEQNDVDFGGYELQVVETQSVYKNKSKESTVLNRALAKGAIFVIHSYTFN